MVRPRVFFDITVGTEQLGRIIFELYSEIVPKTCENFRALCTGEKGQTSGIPLYYKNSILHRCIKDFMIQGGGMFLDLHSSSTSDGVIDFTKRNGTGGESIYGGTFEDEDLTQPIDSEGLLCMANKGPDSNGSQFFITLRACPHLDGKHVVFGRVLRGFEEVVRKIEKVPCDSKDRPTVPVIISNCGELELRKKGQPPPPPKTEKRSASLSGSDSEEERKQSKRRSRRSRSRSRSVDSEDKEERRRRKKSKRKHKSEKKDHKEKTPEDVPHKETEEEYDARLEREEKERLEEARKRDLERVKAQYESQSQSSNGIRYKGRGRMKYIDPDADHGR
ncbi:hypothetical protein VNI00_005183 [Paramarasmius palmivorus]|uniref:peptidylprolyl isomerase n=1 Tax=Paramarasmius palmivorus TaxID=297713 RepID=A0AAW0DEQ0_9AGAR